MTILEGLGIRGIPILQEHAILSGLLTGNPILLIGLPGTAKTEIVTQIGSALREFTRKTHPDTPDRWFSYQTYDCSKLNPEDLIGFINLREMENGQAKIIETPSSIWNKELVCFDEFNRMDPDRQANLFEIIRSRRCLGKSTGTKFIINCMNPFTDEGTLPLSDALVDRHMFYVSLQPFNVMGKEDREYITNRVGASDSIALGLWNPKLQSEFTVTEEVNEKLADTGERIRVLIKKAATETLPESQESVGESITAFLSELSGSLKDKENRFLISGRRSGMLRTGILSMVALSKAANQLFGTPTSPLQDLFSCCVLMGLPIHCGQITDEELSKITSEVDKNASLIFNRMTADDPSLFLQEIWSQKDPIKRLELVLDHENLEILSRTKNWEEILHNSSDSMARFIIALNSITPFLPKEVLAQFNSRAYQGSLDAEVTIRDHSNLTPIIPIIDIYQENHKDDEVRKMLLCELVTHYQGERCSSEDAIQSVARGIGLIERFCNTLTKT